MKQTGTKKQKNTRKTGATGEMLAAEYLQSCGYTILQQNYWKKFGEIDIVARKAGVVHFVEVKTVSYDTITALTRAVTQETWRPEEQVHHFKRRQIAKALEAWVTEHNYTGAWQIDVIGVRLVPRETYCTINLIENITE